MGEDTEEGTDESGGGGLEGGSGEVGENPNRRKPGVIAQPLNSHSTTSSNNEGRSVDRPSEVSAVTRKSLAPHIPLPSPNAANTVEPRVCQ